MNEEQKKDNVQLIDDDEIITLYGDDDEPIDFYEEAVVEYNSELYAILQPCDKFEDLEDDEVLIFKIEEVEGKDEDTFVFVEDEEIADAVFEEYLRAATPCEEGACEGCPSQEGCDKKK